MNLRRSELRGERGLELTDSELLPEGVIGRIHAMPPTPMTRSVVPGPLHLKNMIPWASENFLRRLKEAEQRSIIKIQQRKPPPKWDYYGLLVVLSTSSRVGQSSCDAASADV